MKILVFEPFARREGHFGVYASQVCQELSLKGHNVTLVTTRLDTGRYLSSGPKFRIVETVRDTGADEGGRASFLASALRGAGIIVDNIVVLSKLLNIYGRGRFNLVHFFDFEPVSTVAVLSIVSLFGIRLSPLFVVVHAPDPSFQGHGNPLYQLYGKLSRPMLRALLSRFADGITAHGQWKKDELAGLLGIPSSVEKIRLVPYGTAIPESLPSKTEARKALGIDYTGDLLLFFGMLRKDKGVELLIEAMGKLNKDCRLLLAGTPFDWTKEEIHRMIREHRAEERVIPKLEYIPERRIPEYFAAADALVLPYKRHYMGAAGPLKTGLGFGLPVVAARVRELEEFMKMARIGVATEPEDAEALRAGIERFLSTRSEERNEMAANGRRLAKDCSWSAVAGRFSEIYASLGGKGSPGP